VPFCDLRAAHDASAAATEAALLRVARSGRYVLGPELDAFEHELTAVCRTGHAIGVGSGTDAIALTLRAAGIGAGDEVVVPAYTAAATWMAIALAGADPVGADVDARTGLVDPAAAAAAIGPRTRALVAVHLFGRLAPVGELRRLAHRHGLLLIEDAAHALGVDEGEGPPGSLGDVAAFSFYPTKTLGGLGDGGAVVTGDPELAAKIRSLRSYGWSEWQGQAAIKGTNSRLDEIQAAVLRGRLAGLPRAHARLRALGAGYRARLAGRESLTLIPAGPDGREPPWHQFVIAFGRRRPLREELARAGIGTAVHYDPLPPQLEAFSQPGRFARAEALASRAISLPFDWWLTDRQAERVCDAVEAAIGSAALSET
jgi:dTDP-3-amino-3,4,6-trideoxy-alpha-D-glucose transaminase